MLIFFFFFKQKTAYEMRISDWSSDVVSSDLYGFMRITDRKKDVIKSGGEWVSSIDIENAAVACPGVKFAAVVGVFHPKWEERPILIVETHEDSTVTAEAMLAHLAPHMPRWWLPDVIIFETVDRQRAVS